MGPSSHVKPEIVRHELDCKMTIVVRADKKSGITTGGTSAKLVSLAVIKAYEAGKIFDPVSTLQWETNAWTKICLKIHSDEEIRELAAKAAEIGLNHYLLERPVTLLRPKQVDPVAADATQTLEEEKKSSEIPVAA